MSELSEGVREGDGERIDNRVIPVMREAIATVQMMLFAELKDDVMARYQDWPEQDRKRLVGAIVNDVFGTPAVDGEAWQFARRHLLVLEEELKSVAGRIPDLLDILTDALRMQTICDNQEGIHSIATLLRAREVGILRQDRPLPMPSTFMINVRNRAVKYGLVAPMQASAPPAEDPPA